MKIHSKEQAVEPIRWRNDALEVLDQRLLPDRTRYFDCRTPKEVAAAIRDMALRGAPLIGCAAAYGMALAVPHGRRTAPEVPASLSALKEAARLLKAARPTAVALAYAIDRILATIRKGRYETSAELRRVLEAEAAAISSEDKDASRRMAELGAALLPANAVVMTYCNTGALATAGGGTALAVIFKAHEEGHIREVFACETRPYLQGSRLTLWELMRGRIPARLITDNMAAAIMPRERVDAVLVGADRIAANGDTANKIGTFGVAIIARHHRIPFYVVAPTSTIDLGLPEGSAIPIEERSGEEVLYVRTVRIAPKGARACHPSFDVTPNDLITAIITEQGVFRPPYRFKKALGARPRAVRRGA